jgi:hypothetical protein
MRRGSLRNISLQEDSEASSIFPIYPHTSDSELFQV